MAIAPSKTSAARDSLSKATKKRDMRKWFLIGLVAGIVLGAIPAFAAQGSKINHVPEKIGDDIRLIYPSASKRNHVLIVNVDDAVPADLFATAVTYAMSRININVWTNSLERSVVRELIEKPERQSEFLGPRAVVAVFLENNAEGVSFLNAPGHWAMVNMRGIDRDSPDAQTLRDRYAKMILKGVGHASGVGASVDELCSLNYDSYTLKGMDKTDIRLSPMAYFPMLSTLQALGGADMVNPAYE